jgi:hypothetical protein
MFFIESTKVNERRIERLADLLDSVGGSRKAVAAIDAQLEAWEELAKATTGKQARNGAR